MNDNIEGIRWLSIRNLGIAAVIILIILGISLLWLIFGQDSQNQLMPILPTPTAPTQVVQLEPETVTFTELNDNPLAYLNQSILVSGEFLPVDNIDCKQVVGPDIRWSLAADNLQLDVLGFERIVRLLPAGATMTIQGIWRLYQGPLGCGKAPPPGSMWYLDAKKIIQPNPLVSSGGLPISVEIKTGELELPSIIPTEQPSSDPVATPSIPATSTAGAIIPTPTIPSQIVPTQTPALPGGVTPSATVTQSPTNVVPSNTPDPIVTTPAPTGIATAVPTQNPEDGTPTMTAEAPPIPATATETNGGGYPGPGGTSTPTPTATVNPYP